MSRGTATPDLAVCEARAPRRSFLPFAPPLLGPEEKAELLDTLESGWITTGPKTERFERELAAYVGAGYAVAVNSCTAAMHLALAAYGIGEGDEVIVPTYTFASSAHVVMYQRAKPVFVDIERDTFNMDADRVEEAMTGRTKAILPVHYGGQPCDLDAIYDIGRRRRVVVIEDAAHAIGSAYHGRKIGGFGRLACFSFYATKNLTTGEGGMAVLDDAELAQRMRVMAMYGISDARRIWERYGPHGQWFYDVEALGYKYNMTDLQAALGLHQLAKLDRFIERRTRFAAMYTEGFADLEELVTPVVRPGVRHAWHLYSVLLRPERLTISRDQFIEALQAEQIGTSVLFRPLHLQSYYRRALGYREGQFPNSEAAFGRTISLPISPKMSDDDVLDVIGAVRRIAVRYRA